MDSNERIEYLYQRYVNNQATPEEVDEFFIYAEQAPNKENIVQLFDKTWNELQIPPGSMPVSINTEVITEKTKAPVRRMIIRRWAVAASIILIVGLGIFISKELATEKSHPAVATTPHDVEAPKNTRATITLVDGRTVALDSITAITQSNVQLTKTADGKITYHTVTLSTGDKPATEGHEASTVSYNTLTNPRGSKTVSLTLADGTKVWLNSESSLRYPVAFVGNERKVEITGEAYFEVKHNDKMPFKVVANGAQIEDLGTEFNVNAYTDENATRTTLIRGSIAVTLSGVEGSTKRKPTIIKPGQQAVVTQTGVEAHDNINLEKITAWKNDEFYFQDDDLPTVMRQLARWYDLQLTFSGQSNRHYIGRISKGVALSKVLDMLRQIGYVEFEVNGKEVKVKMTE